LHAALRRLDEEGVASAAELPFRGLPPRSLHLPLSLDARRPRLLGQSLRLALRARRLSRPAPPHAARDGERGWGALTLIQRCQTGKKLDPSGGKQAAGGHHAGIQSTQADRRIREL